MSSALRPFARLAALRFGTLSTRIAVLYAGLFALVLGVVVSLAAGGLSRFGEASAARDLAANARVFDEILAARARQMGDQAGVLARDFGFREAVATGDAPTIASALASLEGRVRSDMAFVLTLEGEVLAADARDVPASETLWTRLDAGSTRGIIASDKGLALAAAAPIEAPDLIGWLVIAQPLDRAELDRLVELAPIALEAQVAEVGSQPQWLRGAAANAVFEREAAGERFLYHVSDLAVLQDGIAPRLVLRHGLAESLAAYASLKWWLTLLAVGGIALAPGDGEDGLTLMKNADLALYRAKQEGKAAYHFFEPALDEAARQRRQLELDLRAAIKEGAFELNFQPLYSLAEKRLTGFEALIRWNHPTRGRVSPVEFIPLAEETGLIVPIGEWVLREACHQASTWPTDVSVAVNVSPKQFAATGVASTVLSALSASGLAPQRLELEITESIFIADVDQTLATLHSLRNLGVRIALDDFGTGYSSLSYLRSFPFDKVKIDKSFVEDLGTSSNGHAVIRAITTLADALGMETLAEGVEDVAQFEVLEREGCQNIQGYLFSRPVAADAVAG